MNTSNMGFLILIISANMIFGYLVSISFPGAPPMIYLPQQQGITDNFCLAVVNICLPSIWASVVGAFLTIGSLFGYFFFAANDPNISGPLSPIFFLIGTISVLVELVTLWTLFKPTGPAVT